MATHKFAVGQTLYFLPGLSEEGKSKGHYKVVQQLPGAGNMFQYRIRCEMDGQEHIVREDQLTRRRLGTSRRPRAAPDQSDCNRRRKGPHNCAWSTRNIGHLIDILVIAVRAVIACAASWNDIALYGRSKLSWLRTFLELPNGILSHDTFRRVFMLMKGAVAKLPRFSAWAYDRPARHT